MPYTIDTDVPMPPLRQPVKSRYAGLRPVLQRMEVGHSVFVPAAVDTPPFAGKVRDQLKRRGIRVTVRRVEGGFRIWRYE